LAKPIPISKILGFQLRSGAENQPSCRYDSEPERAAGRQAAQQPHRAVAERILKLCLHDVATHFCVKLASSPSSAILKTANLFGEFLQMQIIIANARRSWCP
jgi:hypothetical protein